MTDRLKSGFWVSAFIRRVQIEGAYGLVQTKGDEDAGSIYIEVDRLDGEVALYKPASAFSEDGSYDPARKWVQHFEFGTSDALERMAFLAKQKRLDSDLWLVVVEDRNGRHFLLDEELKKP